MSPYAYTSVPSVMASSVMSTPMNPQSIVMGVPLTQPTSQFPFSPIFLPTQIAGGGSEVKKVSNGGVGYGGIPTMGNPTMGGIQYASVHKPGSVMPAVMGYPMGMMGGEALGSPVSYYGSPTSMGMNFQNAAPQTPVSPVMSGYPNMYAQQPMQAKMPAQQMGKPFSHAYQAQSMPYQNQVVNGVPVGGPQMYQQNQFNQNAVASPHARRVYRNGEIDTGKSTGRKAGETAAVAGGIALLAVAAAVLCPLSLLAIPAAAAVAAAAS